MSPAKTKRRPPFPFVQEALASAEPEVRRMFSGYAVYLGDLFVCLLRDHHLHPEDNGVWIVLSEGTDPEDKSLRRDLPSLRRISYIHSIHHWLLIPSDGPGFEEEALRACELLLHRDARLGRIPQSRR